MTEDIRTHKTDRDKLRGDIVLVLVGVERRACWVHKDLLSHSSQYFQDILSGGFDQNPETETVHLPEHEPEIFAIYICWLYSGKISTDHYGGPNSDLALGMEPEYTELVKAWVLGDKLACPAFQNAVIKALIATLEEDKDADFQRDGLVAYLYEHTATDAVLRRLFLDMCICSGRTGWVDSFREDMSGRSVPPAFLVDLVRRLYDFTHFPCLEVLRPEDYHLLER